ncbi:MAG TPA: hypothetical protein VHZ78_06585 [Rhizomicrobium sp.]|jgi:hypothetical protein|nr:hypothetical protein [Rhizomicrobium sp.]
MGAEFWAAIWGALVGSVAGGIISAVLQYSAAKNSKRDQAEAELERRRALATSLMLKIGIIASHLSIIERALATAKEAAIAAGASELTWQWLQSPGNIPAAITFAIDEIGLLYSLGDPPIFAAVLLCDERHNGVLDHLAIYAKKRAELLDMLASPGMDSLTVDRKIDLNLLIAQLQRIVLTEREASQKALVAFKNELAKPPLAIEAPH